MQNRENSAQILVNTLVIQQRQKLEKRRLIYIYTYIYKWNN